MKVEKDTLPIFGLVALQLIAIIFFQLSNNGYMMLKN